MEALAPVLPPAGMALTVQVSPHSRIELRWCDSGTPASRIQHTLACCSIGQPPVMFVSGDQRHYFSWGLFAMVSNAPGDRVPGELPSGAQPHMWGAEK